jgi:hypothetical protein
MSKEEIKNNLKLTPNKINYNHIDGYNLVVNNKGYGDGGKGDAVGRTSFALLYYGGSRYGIGMANAIYNCLRGNVSADFIYHPYRHPLLRTRNDMSRDHIINSVSALKIIGRSDLVRLFLKNRAWRPSKKFRYTLDNKIWFRALYSNFWSYMFAIYMTPYLLFTEGFNRFFRVVGGYGVCVGSPNIFQKVLNKTVFKLFPTFASSFTLSQINALNSIKCRDWLRKIIIHHFEPHNHFQRLRCGYPPIEDPNNPFDTAYVSRRCFRWTTREDETFNRNNGKHLDRPDTNVEIGVLIGALIEYYENKEIPNNIRMFINYFNS